MKRILLPLLIATAAPALPGCIADDLADDFDGDLDDGLDVGDEAIDEVELAACAVWLPPWDVNKSLPAAGQKLTTWASPADAIIAAATDGGWVMQVTGTMGQNVHALLRESEGFQDPTIPCEARHLELRAFGYKPFQCWHQLDYVHVTAKTIVIDGEESCRYQIEMNSSQWGTSYSALRFQAGSFAGAGSYGAAIKLTVTHL